jgi:hypothetical protein
LTSIGDITLSLTEPDAFVNLEIGLNADLTSIGDITLSTFSYIIIASNPLLTTLGTLTFGQWTVDPYNYPIYLGFNAFDTAAISKIFTDLDATGITNSTVVVQGNPGSAGPFTVPGQAAYLSLQGKGWTIIV